MSVVGLFPNSYENGSECGPFVVYCNDQFYMCMQGIKLYNHDGDFTLVEQQSDTYVSLHSRRF